ncbi:hypothetical protein HN604_03860 [archaeon]|jgi:RNase P subunit RPR2|nr:hypothetical protein [archaeon]MBT6182304.1 hypothetical protein [archaeon]MBT6606287.1 hypothetical protein [archaeon]MBT7251544.1 hypothetical protein [archaeon]MBT7661185.1 hypothetical protein [archaeon]
MKQTCNLCGEDLKSTFLDKPLGTHVRLGSGEGSRVVAVCSSCQKKHKENLLKEVRSKN